MSRKTLILILMTILAAFVVLITANEVVFIYRANSMENKVDLIKKDMTHLEVMNILGKPTGERWIDSKRLKDDIAFFRMDEEEANKIIDTYYSVLLQYSYCISQRRPPLFLEIGFTKCLTFYFDSEEKRVLFVSGYTMILD